MYGDIPTYKKIACSLTLRGKITPTVLFYWEQAHEKRYSLICLLS